MEKEIENELERLGLEPTDRGRYWLIHCPQHDDANKSAQCFKDGWIHCHAGCKRIHINSLSGRNICRYETNQTETSTNTRQDFTELWMGLEPITEDIKGVPAAYLRKLGWKKFDGGGGVNAGVFIPYFNITRNKVHFYQIRHDKTSSRRFTFARGCSPSCYGLECLSRVERHLLVTEGSRDSVILRMAGVPAVAVPSASSGVIVKNICKWCKDNRKTLVWAGDNDDAGDRLQTNITIPYIDARVTGYKDIGELYAEKGLEEIKKVYEKYRVDTNPIV